MRAIAVIFSWSIFQFASVAGGREPLTFAQAMETAKMQSPEAQEANAELALAQAQSRESFSFLLPKIGSYATYRNFTLNPAVKGMDIPGLPLPETIGPVSDWETGLIAHINLVDVSAWQRSRAADSRLEAERFGALALRERIAYATGKAYLACALAQRRVENRKLSSAMAESLLVMARSRMSMGAITNLDLTHAELQVLTSRDDLLLAKAEAEEGVRRLKAIMGVPLDQSLDLADTLDVPPPDSALDEDALEIDALENRNEIHQGEEGVLASSRAVGSARAQFLPVLSLSGEYGVAGTSPGKQVSVRSVAVSLEWMLWEGGGRRARRDKEMANMQLAEARLRRTRIDVSEAVHASVSRMRTSRERVGTAMDQLRLAKQELRETSERFGLGAAGSAEMIDSQNRIIRSRDFWFMALHDYNASRLDLFLSLGRLGSL